MLELRHVHAGYGRLPVLFDINFFVQAGELVAVLGPNGAGKSTLLKTVLGVVRPRQGIVVFEHARVTHEPPHIRFGRGIALSPEGRRIFKDLTVRENLVAGSSNVSSKVVQRQTERVYELFPILRERSKQRAGSLSGGEQQMLAIGRALVSAPKLLLIDEMSMGLAPLVLAELYQTVQQLAREGLAVVVVDQFSKLVGVADRACILEKGRIVFDGSRDEAEAELSASTALGQLGRA
jgi:branched-chain amino acid transport system ATP-binding protein